MENNSIFISYSHKDKFEADYIDKYFKFNGVILRRDVREVGYTQSFISFMQSIRKNDYVLMLISRNYLYSVNCMYEVIQVMKEIEFNRMIHPIIINSDLLYSVEGNLEIIQYWTRKYEELKTKIEKVNFTDVIHLTEELKKIQEIKQNIGEFLKVIKDNRYLSFEEHKKNNFKNIFDVLEIIPLNQISTDDEIKYHNRDYYILKEEDISHATAKRFSATVLLNRDMNKNEIKEVINNVTNEMKENDYARNNLIKSTFSGKHADVVWLFFARDLTDSNNSNWICRTQWVNPKLANSSRPTNLNGNDEINGINISWNDGYVATKEYYDKNSATKSETLDAIDNIIPNMLKYADDITNKFNEFKNGNIEEKVLIHYSNLNKDSVTDLYLKSTNLKIPPIELEDYTRAVDRVAASIDNLFLYYCDSGIKTWKFDNRKWLFENTVKTLNKDIESLNYESKKIRK